MNFMKFAIEEAKKSDNDIPVGAEKKKKKKASQKLNNWRLEDCELYVTLEPCPMCGWAILQSRIKSVYFGSYDVNYGSFSSKIDLRKLTGNKLNIYGGIEEKECDKLLSDFFEQIRK